jgi:putative hemolysin
MSAIAMEIALILLLIIANGVFSGSEIAVVSARKIRLEHLADRGNRQAKIALKLANSPNDFLSTVQIGITLIGILSGAVGGATLAQRLKPAVEQISALQAYSEGISVVIVVTIITYLSLVVGELLPKRIALNSPERIACTVAKPMRLLARFTAPLVHILGISTEFLLKLLGIRASDEPEITEEEIRVLIRQGAASGMFEESEQEMVERVFRLGDRSIKALMTPRTETVWLDLDSSLEDNLANVIGSIYSRFPVGRGSLDNCVGIVRASSLLSARLSGEEVDLEKILQPPLYVAETTRALNVLEQFKQTGVHLALICNEYGGIEGLVTLNDLMEAIVGNIPSVEYAEDLDIVQREDGSWLVDGLVSIDRVKELLDCESLPKEETGRYHTLGGFALDFLEHIPRTGEHFEWNEFQFEIVDMDGQRIDKILITGKKEEVMSNEP